MTEQAFTLLDQLLDVALNYDRCEARKVERTYQERYEAMVEYIEALEKQVAVCDASK